MDQFSFPESSVNNSQRPCQEVFLTQRRKDAAKNLGNAAALCAFAPLREKYFSTSGVTNWSGRQNRHTARHRKEAQKGERFSGITCALLLTRCERLY